MKTIILSLALACTIGAHRAQAQTFVYYEVFDSIHVVSPTLIQVCHHTELEMGDYTTSHGFVGAVWPEETPFTYVNNNLDTAWGGNTYYVENVAVVPGTSYGFTAFGTHAMDTTEVQPWTAVITYTAPSTAVKSVTAPHENEMSIAPNPMTMSAEIRCADWQGKTFKVFDLSGRLVKEIAATSEATVFSKDNLSPGTYIVRDEVRSQRIVIQ